MIDHVMWMGTFTITIISTLIATVSKIVGEFSKVKTTLELYMLSQDKVNGAMPSFERRIQTLEDKLRETDTSLIREVGKNDNQNQLLGRLDERLDSLDKNLVNLSQKVDNIGKQNGTVH